jgi:4-diphosphocytidyl-2-C-methyl-D-erythritol kinase
MDILNSVNLDIEKFLKLPAPAKLNLFLLVTGRRADGYHNIQTLFQLLDYGDHIYLKTSETDPRITLLTPLPGVSEEHNLVVRAALSLQQIANYQGGAQIAVEKRLPLGGGLGGGSSDAASTLLGLNLLWKLGLSIDQLADIGLTLGADVPVFVRGFSAIAEGVGEQLTPQQIVPRWYLVITPQITVNTGEIVTHPELTRTSAAIKIPALFEVGPGNDCQPIAESLYPEIRRVREWLGQFAEAQLTGTGASVFAAFEDEDFARQVLAQVPQEWQAFIARGLHQSPVHQKLAERVDT